MPMKSVLIFRKPFVQFTMQCRVTRKPCIPGGGDCDRPIYCIDGLCLIGRNCTPIEGLDCDDLGN